MKTGAIIIIILAALTFGAMNYHFILFDDSLKILKKSHLTLDSTFVDARGSKKFKLLLNPELMNAGFNKLLEDFKSGSGKK